MMKRTFRGKDVLYILARLKNAENNYPKDLMEPRRVVFVELVLTTTARKKAEINRTELAGGR